LYFQSPAIASSDLLTGKVTGMRYLDHGASAPVISYEWKGNQRSHESNTYANPADYTAGQTVSLYY
jgi:hypothetical protein